MIYGEYIGIVFPCSLLTASKKMLLAGVPHIDPSMDPYGNPT